MEALCGSHDTWVRTAGQIEAIHVVHKMVSTTSVREHAKQRGTPRSDWKRTRKHTSAHDSWQERNFVAPYQAHNTVAEWVIL